MISNADLELLGIYACRHCNSPDALFLQSRTLKAHTTRKHSASRTQTNSDLLQSTYRHADPNAWTQTLQWLQTHSITPPSFPTNLWRTIRFKTQLEFFTTLHHVHEWILDASSPLDDAADHPAYQTSPEPLWKLLLLLETLLLHPITDGEPKSPDLAVLQRLSTFRRGHISQLYLQASSISVVPNTSPIHFAADDDPCPSAQSLADSDNLRSAYQRIQSALPTAKMTPEVTQRCSNLYPSRVLPCNTPSCSRSSSANHPQIPLSENLLYEALSKLKSGTAGGPFSDLTDVLKSYALYRPAPQGDETMPRPYTQTFCRILRLILSNDIPKSIVPFLSANRFIALHKDPNDDSKLRPIGIGTAYRRIAGAVIMTLYANRFSSFLLTEGQFGIAISGGIDFLLHSAQAQLHQYIDRPLASNQAPHRALLSLDITNMFNAVSRDAARAVLANNSQFHALLPYFDLMYGSSNRCFFTCPDGSSDYFLQHEGFPQGDPLAPVLACLVLHQLLQSINKQLLQRAAHRLHSRQPGDDGYGSLAATLSYIDDTFLFLMYDDLPWFIQSFKTLGLPLGIRLNPQKTKILTLTTTDDSATILSPSQFGFLTQALLLLNGAESESKQGIKLLGTPLGSPVFAASFATFQQTNHRSPLQALRTSVLITPSPSRCASQY
jgi:hypothetical protein